MYSAVVSLKVFGGNIKRDESGNRSVDGGLVWVHTKLIGDNVVQVVQSAWMCTRCS